MINIKSFSAFNSILEGGAAIKSSRRIREDEVSGTLSSIKENLLDKLSLKESDYMVIGSTGKKANPSDTSGDLDIGIFAKALSSSLGTTENLKEVATALNEKVEEIFKNWNKEESDSEIRHLKGLNIVSVGWPINGDFANGLVQLDLIPIIDIEWAKFIYYSPDEKRGESKYKSAHRNWLFSAILSARKEIIEEDSDGEVMVYKAPVLVLSDGLYMHTKSHKGIRIPRVKRAKKIEGSEKLITRSPEKFIEYVLGKKYNLDKVKTFEDVMSIIKSPEFDLKDKLPEIRDKYIEFMERTSLDIPKEIKEL